MLQYTKFSNTIITTFHGECLESLITWYDSQHCFWLYTYVKEDSLAMSVSCHGRLSSIITFVRLYMYTLTIASWITSHTLTQSTYLLTSLACTQKHPRRKWRAVSPHCCGHAGYPPDSQPKRRVGFPQEQMYDPIWALADRNLPEYVTRNSNSMIHIIVLWST